MTVDKATGFSCSVVPCPKRMRGNGSAVPGMYCTSFCFVRENFGEFFFCERRGSQSFEKQKGNVPGLIPYLLRKSSKSAQMVLRLILSGDRRFLKQVESALAFESSPLVFKTMVDLGSAVAVEAFFENRMEDLVIAESALSW